MENLNDLVKSGKNSFQELMEKIPGIKGYKAKEDRRDTDKIIREEIAKKFEEEWSRISAIQRDLIKAGNLNAVSDLESAAIKIRQFTDRIKTAPYGYAGLLDAIKVDDAALTRLYDYDLYLLKMADTVKASVDEVEKAVAADPDNIKNAISQLTKAAQDSLTAFNQRTEVIIGANDLNSGKSGE